MGYNLYITRAEYWAENEKSYISADEWLEIVEKDPSLTLDTGNGLYHTLWFGKEDYWLDWSQGNIYTKYPDENLIGKMYEIAQSLGAQVHGEENEVYVPGQEPYYPQGRPEAIIISPKKARQLKIADLFFIVITAIGCLSITFSNNKSFDYRYIIIGVGVFGMLAISILERRK